MRDRLILALLGLNNRVLTDIEIKALEKGLDFDPIQGKINEPELKQDFAAEFCSVIRT